MNFSRPDAADAKKLNAILWQDAKGDISMSKANSLKPFDH